MFLWAKIRMACFIITDIFLQSRPIFQQDENPTVFIFIVVRTGQILDYYRIFHRRHAVPYNVIFQPPGKGDTHLYLILHPVGKGFPRLIARHGFLPGTDMAVDGGFDETVDLFTA